MTDDIRDAVAKAIEAHLTCSDGEWAENLSETAEHLADAAIAAYRHACRIDTVEQLEALPVRSLVRDEIGEVWERLRSGWDCLSGDGEGGVLMSTAIRQPAVLLWSPEWGTP